MTGDVVKPIEFPFTADQYLHELVERDGLVCLVKRTNMILVGTGEDRRPAGSVHWEVVVLREQPGRFLPPEGGDWYPPRETYPRSEDWGECGWTYTDESRARARMAILRSTVPITAPPAAEEP